MVSRMAFFIFPPRVIVFFAKVQYPLLLEPWFPSQKRHLLVNTYIITGFLEKKGSTLGSRLCLTLLGKSRWSYVIYKPLRIGYPQVLHDRHCLFSHLYPCVDSCATMVPLGPWSGLWSCKHGLRPLRRNHVPNLHTAPERPGLYHHDHHHRAPGPHHLSRICHNYLVCKTAQARIEGILITFIDTSAFRRNLFQSI